MKNVIVFTVILLCLLTNELSAKVTGFVYAIENGSKVPLNKVKIMWENSTIGAYSDLNGKFEIEKTSSFHMLSFSYIGYEKEVLHIDDDNAKIEVELKSNVRTEDIVIEAEKPALLFDKTNVVASEQITLTGLRKAACCNLSESFETNPTIDVSYSDAVTGAKQIMLLGLSGVYTHISTEKVPNLSGLAAAYGLNFVPGTWMESINISKGTSTVTTGYEGIAGLINIEYKKPENLNPLLINLYASDKQRFEANVDYSLELNNKLWTSFFVSGATLQNKIDNNKDKFLDQALFNQYNLMNRWKYQDDDFEAILAIQILEDDRKSGQIELAENTKLYEANVKTNRQNVFSKIGFFFDESMFSSFGNILSVTNHKQESHYGNRPYNASQLTLFYNGIIETGENFYDGHKITLGISNKYDKYDELFDTSSVISEENVAGLFAEYTYIPFDNLTLVAGFRADYHNKYEFLYTPRFHLKWDISEENIFRFSIGTGKRVARIYADNQNLMVSNRNFYVLESLKPEDALTLGFNYTGNYELFESLVTLKLDYYRTDFMNQVIYDTQVPNKILIYNLDGQSYANAFQIDLILRPFTDFEISSAFRYLDVKQTYGNELKEKPMVSKLKSFVNLAYKIGETGKEWKFDYTIVFNGGGNMHPMLDEQNAPIRTEKYDSFVTMLGQITKKFDNFEIYLGSENISDFTQKNPIIHWENPESEKFDASNVWGPILGRNTYLGIRWEL